MRPLTFPASLDDADAADFIAMVDVRNEAYREMNGNDDERMTPAERCPSAEPGVRAHPHVDRPAGWGGRRTGRPAAPARRRLAGRVHQHRALRRAWGRGIGRAAHRLLEDAARAQGRSVLQAWSDHASAAGTDDAAGAERLVPPTGFGSLPLDHTARFMRAHGYTLEQIERNSVLALTNDARAHVERLLAEARAAATGYRVVQWAVPTPAEYVDGYAWMKSRMVTDAPSAALEFDDEVWDAARLADHERPYLEAGRTLHVTAAQHIATGELAAFNELVIGTDRTAATSQEDTLVLAEHRGHRLGLLVKCQALHDWHQIAPRSPRVITYNAEENQPMLDINERIGFVPVAYNGAWKKTLSR
ncbi:GNAT family N-acetyltransferase [Microbacterium elymi]|uniref:GNAT family N-acetyltransferase n=1 Tax=Microbacterium elymi TaxID=2909587 RepID=A0ABY5NJV9_9MICO|nr:GNAT family N-acetyltransferase [Microbacterium elymi]UUT35449.1 GNAT family N-acetyltransferase [Microbacterium elymi]